ncbi:MAG: ATP-binding cassette domain-containing protein, partial [Armatimonadia bacterium]|nr:ATP-binding cassette domain-containing protein [Armatimonadia bacterium]
MKSSSNFRRFLGFIRPHKWRFIEIVFYSAIVAVVTLPVLLILKEILVRVPPLIEAETYQQAFAVGAGLVGARFGISLLERLIGFRRQITTVRLGERLVFDIRQQLYRHIQKLSLRYYEGVQTGGIMSRVLWDVEGIRQISTGALSQFVVDSVVLIVFAIFLFIRQWEIGLMACLFLPLYVLNYKLFKKRIRSVSIEVRDKFTSITNDLQERVSGVRVVKSFATERTEARAFVSLIRENLRLSVRQGMWSAAFGHMAGFISLVGTEAVALFIVWRACFQRGDMVIEDLVVFGPLLARMFQPIINMTNVNDAIVRASACIDRIFATLDTIPDVEESDDAITPDEVQGEVEFEDVYFAYEPDELVLKNVSFVAEPGTVTALVGPSGGGKSTLINLVPRFYDPISGTVKLDGTDLKRLKLSA